MSVQRVRTIRPFPISAVQLDMLRKAEGRQLGARGSDDEAACLALWRTGLLRLNGETGFQLSQLGFAAIRAQEALPAGQRTQPGADGAPA